MAQRSHLRPGDRALMRGTLHPQTIELGNGETTIVNNFYVIALEMLSRSKRTSITVYELEIKIVNIRKGYHLNFSG
jgi:hypothetical protein